jgi:hypothetical protein
MRHDEEGRADEQAGRLFTVRQNFPDNRVAVQDFRLVPSAGSYRRSSLTVSFHRPFARRLESTLRPFFDAIRARNPCVLRLFLLWG